MTIKQAIEKAIEGGWKPTLKYDPLILTLDDGEWEFEPYCFLIDPLFWQSLGRASGWKEITCRNEQLNSPECRCDGGGVAGWFYNWHRFIDHLAEGKDAESYFQSL